MARKNWSEMTLKGLKSELTINRGLVTKAEKELNRLKSGKLSERTHEGNARITELISAIGDCEEDVMNLERLISNRLNEDESTAKTWVKKNYKQIV